MYQLCRLCNKYNCRRSKGLSHSNYFPHSSLVSNMDGEPSNMDEIPCYCGQLSRHLALPKEISIAYFNLSTQSSSIFTSENSGLPFNSNKQPDSDSGGGGEEENGMSWLAIHVIWNLQNRIFIVCSIFSYLKIVVLEIQFWWTSFTHFLKHDLFWK